MRTSVIARGIAVLAFGIEVIFAAAALGAEPPSLTLSQAVEVALRGNSDLKSFREEKGIYEAAMTRAETLPNPVLEFAGSTGALAGSPDSTVSVGVAQDFLLGGKREKRRLVAEREMEMYRWQVADRERLLRGEVQVAFYDALLAAKRIELAERGVRLSRQLSSVTAERLAAGDVSELEMNLVKVEVARSEGNHIEARRGEMEAREKLFALMSLPTESYGVVVGELGGAGNVPAPLDTLRQLAPAHRPDLKALEAERTRGDADFALARAEQIPDITAALSVSRDTTAIEVGGVEGRDTAYLVGVRLTVPIPVFDRNRARLQGVRARSSVVQSRLLAAEQAVDREVDIAYAAYLNSEKVAALYRSGIIPQLEENLKLVQEAYRLGEVGLLEVIQEQKKFTEVHENYLTALHDRSTALARLATAVAADPAGGGK